MSSSSTILGVVGGAAGFILTGFNLQGAAIGYTLGSTLGSILTPRARSEDQPPAMGQIQIMSAGYGQAIPVQYGTRKISGNVIWYGNFQRGSYEEEITGEGSDKGGSAPQTNTVYYYTCSLAVGLGFGLKGAQMLRIWQGKNLIYDGGWTDSAFLYGRYLITFYDGSQVVANAHITSLVTRAPVWKDLAYVVFQDYMLGSGTSVPNFTFEVGFGEREFLRQWGTTGAGDGQLYNPMAVKSYKNKVYVLDWHNYRVQIFTPEGTFLAKFGSYGSGAGQFTNPFDVDIYDDKIYVSDSSAGRHIIQIYDLDGNYLSAFGGTGAGDGQLNAQRGLCVYGDTVYVADTGNDRVQLFTLAGVYQSKHTVTSPRYVAADADCIYVVQSTLDHVLVYDHAWSLLATVGATGSGDGQLSNPMNLAIDGEFMYIADYNNNRIAIFTLAGAWSGSVGSNGTGAGEFSHPWDVDAGDFLHVVDYGNDRIQVFALYLDANPADVARDILTDDLYGLGLAGTYLDDDSFEATRVHCLANDLRVSMLYDRQRSVLDALQNLLSHHDGYICYKDGLLYYRQMKEETPAAALDGDAGGDLVMPEKKMPIGLTRRGSRDRQNRVQVEYTKAAAEYVNGLAAASDMADIDATGLRETTVRLDGLTSYSRASKLAFLLLQRSIGNPEQLSFGLGPSRRTLAPGDVVSISNTALELSALPIRLQALREGPDYRLEAEAVEELDVYDYVSHGADSSDPTDPQDLYGDPGDVLGLLLVEPPASYSASPVLAAIYSAGAADAWFGASLYRAYAAGGSYTKKVQGVQTGITGTVSAVGAAAGVAYIDVTLDSTATLSSALDFDDLLITPRKNLIMVRRGTADVYVRFQDADLIGTKQWRLSGLLYDITGTPRLNTYGTVQAADKMAAFGAIPLQLAIGTWDAERTFYVKIASFDYGGFEQSLADVSEVSKAMTARFARPLPPAPVTVNGLGVDGGGEATVAAGDIALAWSTVNRKNAGATNYDRSDAVADDAELDDFTVEIYNGATLLRSVSPSPKYWTYTAAMQVTDGGPFGQYDIRIRQNNSDYSSEWTLVTVYAV